MLWNFLAFFLVITHLVFVAFALVGGVAVLRWPRLAWIHLPAVAWGAWVQFAHRICPLTPLENWLRVRAGEAAYSSGFIEHYVAPVLYPSRMGSGLQVLLGGLLIAVNVCAYAVVWRRHRRRRAF